MAKNHIISNNFLSITQVSDIVGLNKRISLSPKSIGLIKKCRQYLDDKITQNIKPIYGINTGFGSLYNISIKQDDLSKLQENLVMSHACGTGNKVPTAIVKLMLLLKLQALGYGHSGVQLETVNRLIDFYNNDITPIIYTQGSLGASGDLSPLAHLALPLIGKGTVLYNGEEFTGEAILKKFNWKPIALQAKEGLALLNGTQFMSAYGVYNLIEAHKLSYLADLVGSTSLDAFDGRIEPFNDLIHQIRPHKGQIDTAKQISNFLNGSEIIKQEKQHVQDPYSFRCMPQVHGATKDTIDFVTKTFETEINSVTDNPNVFVDEDEIISGGNFHGQTLALALDYLKIAMAELGNISERRIFKLISGQRQLPNFLVKNPGLNSGLMIPQYTAASIVSANKQLASPASIDSIVSSNGQEDHVSMGANAATQAQDVLENVRRVLAIELLNASQALAFRAPLKSSQIIEDFVAQFRAKVSLIEEDRVLHNDVQNSVAFLKNYNV